MLILTVLILLIFTLNHFSALSLQSVSDCTVEIPLLLNLYLNQREYMKLSNTGRDKSPLEAMSFHMHTKRCLSCHACDYFANSVQPVMICDHLSGYLIPGHTLDLERTESVLSRVGWCKRGLMAYFHCRTRILTRIPDRYCTHFRDRSTSQRQISMQWKKF